MKNKLNSSVITVHEKQNSSERCLFMDLQLGQNHCKCMEVYFNTNTLPRVACVTLYHFIVGVRAEESGRRQGQYV